MPFLCLFQRRGRSTATSESDSQTARVAYLSKLETPTALLPVGYLSTSTRDPSLVEEPVQQGTADCRREESAPPPRLELPEFSALVLPDEWMAPVSTSASVDSLEDHSSTQCQVPNSLGIEMRTTENMRESFSVLPGAPWDEGPLPFESSQTCIGVESEIAPKISVAHTDSSSVHTRAPLSNIDGPDPVQVSHETPLSRESAFPESDSDELETSFVANSHDHARRSDPPSTATRANEELHHEPVGSISHKDSELVIAATCHERASSESSPLPQEDTPLYCEAPIRGSNLDVELGNSEELQSASLSRTFSPDKASLIRGSDLIGEHCEALSERAPSYAPSTAEERPIAESPGLDGESEAGSDDDAESVLHAEGPCYEASLRGSGSVIGCGEETETGSVCTSRHSIHSGSALDERLEVASEAGWKGETECIPCSEQVSYEGSLRGSESSASELFETASIMAADHSTPCAAEEVAYSEAGFEEIQRSTASDERSRAAPTVYEEISTEAIGIDLGTAFCHVGVWEGDGFKIIANEEGSRTTPAIVSFSDAGRLVGEAARELGCVDPANTVFDIKRLIGRKFHDAEVQAELTRLPFHVVGRGNRLYIRVHHAGEEKELSPEEICSVVLLKLKNDAEAYLGKIVTDVVITVPAHFNDSQRQATKDAASIAGLNVLHLVNETTAAALAYGLDQRLAGAGRQNVLVLDLGAGSFDVSLLSVRNSVFEVKATAGDARLCGRDFDDRLVQHFAAEFRRISFKDLSSNPSAMGRLRTACQRAKHELSTATQTTIKISGLFEGIDFRTSLTRARFEGLCADLFHRILHPVNTLLRDTNMRKSDVAEIVLVGGSTRIPYIRTLVSQFFDGRQLNDSIDPDEAVVCGSAVDAAVLSGSVDASNIFGSPVGEDLALDDASNQGITLRDLSSLSLGIEVAPHGHMAILIPRNTSIPAKRSSIFTTFSDYQTVVSIPIHEGECVRAKDNNLLGKFDLNGIQYAPQGVPQIEVTFDIDRNGILAVSARDLMTRASGNITINTDKGGLSQQEIDRLTHTLRAGRY